MTKAEKMSMEHFRGGTGHQRNDSYGGKVITRPDAKRDTKSASHLQSYSTANTFKARPFSDSKNSYAKSLGSFFPKLTKQIFEKFGFASVALVSDWAAIVGPNLAEFTRPEKLKWPYTSPDLSGEMPQMSKGHMAERQSRQQLKSQGATLILRVEGARSLEVQFSQGQIIERINTYFGYKAVTDIRILQAPLPCKETAPRKRPLPQLKEPVKGLEAIKNDALKQALERMARGVQSVSSSKTAPANNLKDKKS